MSMTSPLGGSDVVTTWVVVCTVEAGRVVVAVVVASVVYEIQLYNDEYFDRVERKRTIMLITYRCLLCS